MHRIMAFPTHTTGGGQMWRTALENGTEILFSTKTPFCASARRLIEGGADPDALCTMRVAGVPHDSFEPMTLREAGHWTVAEGDSNRARFAKWQPRDFAAQDGNSEGAA